MRVADDTLIAQSATRLAELIRTELVSSTEVVEAHLDRIEAINHDIRAVVMLCADRARAEAESADLAIQRGDAVGPLHGVPFTLKDSYDTAGVISTGGTLGRKDFAPQRDSAVAARLRAAGGILLGKTYCPELTQASDGNLMHPRPNNPYGSRERELSASGSSSGSAALVAACGSPLDFGSDTGGSVRLPAHNCGVAGLKPSAGLAPRTGHIVPWGMGAMDILTQPGPIARRVEDLWLALQIVAGPDGVDPAVAPVPLGDPSQIDLGNLRIAWYDAAPKHERPDDDVRDTVAAAAHALTQRGATTANNPPPLLSRYFELRNRVDGADDFNWVRRLLARSGTTRMSPQLQDLWRQAIPNTLSDYVLTLEAQDQLRSEILQWMDAYDAILAPVTVAAAQPHDAERPGDPLLRNYTGVFNMLGWPAAVVRCGMSDDGLPIGVQIAAPTWRDHVVIAVAAALEESLGGWRPPPI